ncbi:hypothetical protein J7L36_02305, partial [bacterium]|nr:hypothetical protein [bacterium]
NDILKLVKIRNEYYQLQKDFTKKLRKNFPYLYKSFETPGFLTILWNKISCEILFFLGTCVRTSKNIEIKEYVKNSSLINRLILNKNGLKYARSRVKMVLGDIKLLPSKDIELNDVRIIKLSVLTQDEYKKQIDQERLNKFFDFMEKASHWKQIAEASSRRRTIAVDKKAKIAVKIDFPTYEPCFIFESFNPMKEILASANFFTIAEDGMSEYKEWELKYTIKYFKPIFEFLKKAEQERKNLIKDGERFIGKLEEENRPFKVLNKLTN